MKALGTIYRYWLTLIWLAVVAQIAAAVHTAFGYLIFLGAVLLLLLALAARLGKRRILWSLGVPLIVALQIVLAWASESVHAIGILHGLNALVIFGLTGSMTGMAWREARAAAPAAAPAPTA